MNTVIATWLPAEERGGKKPEKKHIETQRICVRKRGLEVKFVCLFYNLLLQNFSSTLVNVLVFFVNFLKIKARLETTENMFVGSANKILIFFPAEVLGPCSKMTGP